MKLSLRHLFWLILAVLACFGGAGCASTDEADNLSSRPWNNPRGWEHGLPGRLNEGR